MVNPNSFLLPLTQITWIPQVRGAVVDVLESLTGVVQGCAVSTVHQVHKHYQLSLPHIALTFEEKISGNKAGPGFAQSENFDM